jgi:hypothetical protein
MSTNLVKLGSTWNIVNNSKYVENQKKLQLQKLFQITSSPSTNFLGIFLTPSYFPRGEFKFWCLNSIWKMNSAWPTGQWCWGWRRARLSGGGVHLATTHRRVGLRSGVKTIECLASPFATAVSTGRSPSCHRVHLWCQPSHIAPRFPV